MGRAGRPQDLRAWRCAIYSGLRLAEKHPVVHNLVISNVPGPPVPIYFMGALVEAMYPLGPIFHGAGLNITVISSNGQLHVGIIALRRGRPPTSGTSPSTCPTSSRRCATACGAAPSRLD